MPTVYEQMNDGDLADTVRMLTRSDLMHEPIVRAAGSRIKKLSAEVYRLRSALQCIAAWDCLNPPARHIAADLPWLKDVVDGALADENDGPDDADKFEHRVGKM